MKSMHEDLNTFHSDLLATDNYLEKYLPFKVLNYIHDALINSLPRLQRGKLISYLNQTYEMLEYIAINDDGKPRLPKREYTKA